MRQNMKTYQHNQSKNLKARRARLECILCHALADLRRAFDYDQLLAPDRDRCVACPDSVLAWYQIEKEVEKSR